MTESDSPDASIEDYLPATASTGRLEFFVRSLAPATGNTKQTDCFDRLRRLAETDQLSDVAVRVWGDGICTHAPEMAGISEMLEAVTDIYSFSADAEAAITPFFKVRRVDSSVTGESFERITPPERTLLAYEGDSLVGVFPCLLGEETYTPVDAIERLEADTEVRVFNPVDTA